MTGPLVKADTHVLLFCNANYASCIKLANSCHSQHTRGMVGILSSPMLSP